MIRNRGVRSGLVCLVAVGVVMAAAPAAFAQVFSYTGVEQSYLVPSGVTSVHVVAVGAPGGGGTQITGGRGAVVSADLPVPQGQTVLYVEVGGTGAGFNGGGSPNGGDASDVRLLPRAAADSINSRVIVAGGGGGVGNYAGGDAGSDGGGADMGGKAGTATAGGSGGQGNPPEACTNGQPGSLGQGGNFSASGGGGGGYYGGGSGGAIGGPNCGPGSYETPGGGGGGGSSYTSPQTMQVTFGLDNSRMSQITITPVITQVTTTPTPVALSALRVNPQRFALTGRRVKNRCLSATASNQPKPRCTRAIAFRVSFGLSGPAKVYFAVKQVLAGRLVGARCRAATHANRLHRRCTLLAQRGIFNRPGIAGQNRVAFNGRLGNRLLGSGSYLLTATVAGNSGNSGTHSALFRITP